MRRVLFVLLLILPAYVTADDYSSRAEVRAFIDEMVIDHDFDQAELKALFEHASYKQSIIDAISRPAEKVLSWKEYQDIFLTRKRVSAGRRFMLENHKALIAANDAFGVPPVIVAAIIGVETMYGQYRGNYRVLDALSTLAFDYPPRSKFFRAELREFLLLAREEKQSAEVPLGSYAGAMGYGQFIPSSYRNYAVDFDGDGHRDIWENRTDAIGSVANYLARHGWEAGQVVTLRTGKPGETHEALFGDDLKPSLTVAELKRRGIVTSVDAADDQTVTPLLLQGKSGPEYWLGFKNFYVITRYNHSKLYAMAVYQLSEMLRGQDLADLNP